MQRDLSRRGWLATLIGGLLGYVVPPAKASAPKRPTPNRRAAVSRPISSASEMGRVTVYTYDALGRLTGMRELPPGSPMP